MIRVSNQFFFTFFNKKGNKIKIKKSNRNKNNQINLLTKIDKYTLVWKS